MHAAVITGGASRWWPLASRIRRRQGGVVGQAGAGSGGIERGPRFDDAMKAVADDDPLAFLAVLPPTAAIAGGAAWRPLDRELSRSTVRADLLGQVGDVVVHGEYVKDRRSDLPLRMVEYRAQIRRRHADRRIVQFVLALADDLGVPDHYADPDGTMVVRWAVVRAADLDRDLLLTRSTTATLASLAQGTPAERARALTAAADLIARTDQSRQRRLLDAAATLASIHLSLPIIESALKEATMPVPVRELPLARALFDEGRAEGRAEGAHEGSMAMSVAILRHRFGDDARISAAAEALSDLTEDEAVVKIMAASRLEDLLP